MVSERLLDILKSASEFRLVPEGFDGTAELRRVWFPPVVLRKEKEAKYVAPEIDAQTQRDIDYLLGKKSI